MKWAQHDFETAAGVTLVAFLGLILVILIGTQHGCLKSHPVNPDAGVQGDARKD